MKMRIYALALLCFILIGDLNAQTLASELILQPPISLQNNQSYDFTLRDKISIKPGLAYKPGAANARFKARLDEKLVMPLITVSQMIQNIRGSLDMNKEVGSSAGVVDVSESGQMTYNLPFSVPPGTANMQPAIGITHNSGMVDGLLGYKFDISGLSNINRGYKQTIIDNKNEVIQFNNTDPFMLNGLRLFPTAGSNGEDLTTYKTEQEQYLLIASHGNTSGPEWFSVKDKDGRSFEYGKTSDSKVMGLNGTILQWNLNRVIDANGNYINYIYKLIGSQVVIDKIEYTGNLQTGLQPYNAIEFYYSSKPNHHTRFAAGISIDNIAILRQVKVISESTLLRTYNFTYGLDITPKLIELSETGQNNISYNTTHFIWNTSQALATTTTINTPNDKWPLMAIGDFDGDGFEDRLFYNYMTSNSFYMQSGNPAHIPSQVFLINEFDRERSMLSVVDIEYDGKDELVICNAKNITETDANYSYFTLRWSNSQKRFIGLPNSDISIPVDKQFIAPRLTLVPIYLNVRENTTPHLLALAAATYIGGKPNTSVKPLSSFLVNKLPESLSADFRQEIKFSDLDADGNTEIIQVIYTKQEKCSLNVFKYNVHSDKYEKIYDEEYDAFEYMALADFNGDAQIDMLTHQAEVKWMLHLFSGKVFLSPNPVEELNQLIPNHTSVIVAEFTGDNMADVLVNLPSNETVDDRLTRLIRAVLNSNTSPNNDQLNSIKTKIQATVNFYKGKIKNEEDIARWSFRTDILINMVEVITRNNYLTSSWHIFRSGPFVSQSPEFNALINFLGVTNNDVPNFTTILNLISYPSDVHQNTHNPLMQILASNGKGFKQLPGSISISGFTSINDCMVADFSGSGKANLYFLRLNNNDYTTRYEVVRINHQEGKPFNTIETIVDGNNIKHVFVYRFTHQYDHGNTVYISGAGINPNPARLSLLRFPLQVVFTYSMCSNLYDFEWKKTYRFGSGLVHRYGKGFLGFLSTYRTTRKVAEADLFQTNQYSFNSYRNLILPFTETISAIGSSGNSNTLLKENKWEYDQALLNQQSFFYKLQLTKQETYDAIKDFRSVAEFKNYDNWGNPTKIENSHVGSNHKIIRDFTFIQTQQSFCPNRISSELITYQKAGNSKQLRTAFTYDARGNVQAKISYDNLLDKVTETFTYNPYGLPVSATITDNSATRTTGFVYDSKCRFVQITSKPLNMVTEQQFDAWGNLVWQKDEQGKVIENTYNGMGRLLSHKDPLGNVTSYALQWTLSNSTDSRYTQTISSPYAKIQTITFNNFGRKINETQINDANQTLVQSYIYETGSRPRHLLKRINKFQLQGSTSSRFTEFNYDDINRLTQTNDEGRITNIQYIRDAGGYHEKTTNINSSNNLLNGVYWVFYNKDGTIKEVNDRGVSVIYSYDEFGNISQINADGAITLITSDAYGRRHTLKDANTGIYTYEYFANGLLRKQIDPQANATEIKYDQLGRTTEQKRINGTATETTTYSYVASGNGKGQLQTISNGITSENYAYDALGRILSITENIKSQNFTTCYEYNSLGRQSKLSYPGGFAILKNYTESGLLASITDAATNNLLWQAAARDVFDRCTQINYAGGLQLINEYKANHTLQRSGISKNGNYIARMEYDINFENGNLNLRKDLVRNLTETFEYDINDRLKKIYLNSVLQYEMQYAPNGNILRKPDIHDPVNGSYQYNANAPHAVTTITNTTINIPAFTGNQQVMMNMAQRAATITKNIGNNTTLKVDITYGPDDERRYAKTEHSLLNNGSSTPTTQSETYYLGNYERIIANGQTKEIYYIGAENGLFAVMIRTGNTQQLYYTFTDNLGSVLELIQPSGVIAESYSFDAWGRRRNTANWSYANITNPTILTRGFTGHEHLDEFGLINMNARLYDPYIARMLGPDKYVQDPANAQNYNRYSYCWNNPLKYTDPDGNLVFGLPLLFWGIAAYTATSSAMIMTGHRPSQTFTVAATVAITVATAGITSSIAASGFLGNTSAIIFGSMVSSSTSFMTSGGKSDLSVSFGVASYSFSRNEFGHLGNDGNSRWENVGYGLGVLANLADVNQLINSTDATLYTQKRYEDGSKDYISHTGIVDDATGEKLMSFGPNSEGFIDGKVGFAIEPKLSTTNYPVPINLSKSVSLAVNKHSFILTRALGKILPYQGLTINCVNMSSLSLWLNGIPNIGIHPALLHFSIQAYKSGLRPDLFSYYLQKR